MTYLNFVSLLLSNIFYSFYFLKRIETKSPDIITNGLENLKNDFEKINFPAALNFNIFAFNLSSSNVKNWLQSSLAPNGKTQFSTNSLSKESSITSPKLLLL